MKWLLSLSCARVAYLNRAHGRVLAEARNAPEVAHYPPLEIVNKGVEQRHDEKIQQGTRGQPAYKSAPKAHRGGLAAVQRRLEAIPCRLVGSGGGLGEGDRPVFRLAGAGVADDGDDEEPDGDDRRANDDDSLQGGELSNRLEPRLL